MAKDEDREDNVVERMGDVLQDAMVFLTKLGNPKASKLARRIGKVLDAHRAICKTVDC
jgi:hypothetical protein